MIRPLLLSDVIAVARVLRAARGEEWTRLLRLMVGAATEAERHRRATGRAHPAFGDGSLMGIALRFRPPPEPPLSHPAYRRALIFVLMAADAYPFAQDRQSGTEGSA